MNARMRRVIRGDEGISLIELLVYMMLSVVVLTIVASILINALRAQSIVRSSATATSSAQLVAQSLNRGIHNASAIQVSTPAAGVTVIRTRSIDSSQAGVWRCEAWALVGTTLRTTSSSASITVPTSASAVSSWLLLADGVKPIGASPAFALASDQRSVGVALTVADRVGVPVTLRTTIVSKQPTPSTGRVSTPCF